MPGVESGHITGKSKEESQRRITGTTLIRRDKERTCLRQPEYFQQYLRQPGYFQQYLRQASRCARRSIAAAQTERRHARQRGMGQYPWGSLVLRESSSHSNFQLRCVLRPKAAPPSRCHKYNDLSGLREYLRQASRCARRSIAAAQTERRHARQRSQVSYT